MREIKFRAWDPEENRMFYPDSISFDEKGGIGCLFQHNNLPDDTEIISGYSKCKLMQFTGLLDKKGVEIYEGDILMLDCDCDGHYGIPEACCKDEVVFEYGKFFLKNTDYQDFADDVDLSEVIGNTYANPELLGKDTHAE